MPNLIKLPSEHFLASGDDKMKPPLEIIEKLKPEKCGFTNETCSKKNELFANKPSKIIRALSKTADTYQLEKFKKNALLIFNNMNIRNYEPRHGTEKDAAILIETFSKFGFEVEQGYDLTRREIMIKLHEFSEKDFTDYGCVAVAVLTHGTSAGHIFARDEMYSEQNIIRPFRVAENPTLITKPKIFMIQACRGVSDPTGVNVTEPSRGMTVSTNDDEEKQYILPYESDMLILHSSYNGKPSFRDRNRGSWFIQALCSKINQLAKTHDLETILTSVKREVAIEHTHQEFNRRTDEIHFLKQMPVVTSTLIRKLYLRIYNEDDKVFPLMQKQTFSPTEDKTKVPSQHQHINCSCYLKHFEYMRNCLKFYLDDNPDDSLAKSIYTMARAFHGPAFNEPKKRMVNVIVQHLKDHQFKYFKYLHIYDQSICNSCNLLDQKNKKNDEENSC